MKVLFLLYNDFTANSASHVAALANKLVDFGHECVVAVPEKKETVATLGKVLFRPVDFQELQAGRLNFSEGAPDVIHVWTPREVVRKLGLSLQRQYGCRLFIHMEDNEWHITSCALGEPFEDLKARPEEELDKMIPPHLSHPTRAPRFLESADGVTVIIDRLVEILPPVRAIAEIWPSADPTVFHPRPRSVVQRRTYGVPVNSTVLVYTGNVHAANACEVRSLYLAVAILNREGHPTTLVRAGRDFHPFLGENADWAHAHSVELGAVPHIRIPDILALADVLVQPGKPDDFNDFRFPSKLPEFLAAQRPVILPATNIARHMTHREHGYVLESGDALSIAAAVSEIMNDEALYRRLVVGAQSFFETRLSWEVSARTLLDFYTSRLSTCYPTL